MALNAGEPQYVWRVEMTEASFDATDGEGLGALSPDRRGQEGG